MTMNRNQYPCVEFDLDKLAANLAALVERCHDSLIEVAGVVKAVSSLPEIVRVYEESGVKFIATSRISQMRAIREAGICKKPLMLIRIPMLSELPDVVELCDISLQSDIIDVSYTHLLRDRQHRQGRSRPGHPEHEPHHGPARDHRPHDAPDVSVIFGSTSFDPI